MSPSGKLTGSTCNGISTGEPYRELRAYLDGKLVGLTPVYFTIYTGGAGPMLWSTIVAHTAYMLPAYIFDLGPWMGLLNSPGGHSITIEMVGCSNANWDVAGVLLVWRSDQRVMSSTDDDMFETSSQPTDHVPDSVCKGDDLSLGGSCKVSVPRRSYSARGSITLEDGSRVSSSVSYDLSSYVNVVSFNNTDGTASYDQSSVHITTSETYVSHENSNRNTLSHSNGGTYPPRILVPALSSSLTHRWANTGELKEGGVWTNSLNFTGHEDGHWLSQHHYQRLMMLDDTNAVCVVPPNITHTVFLRSFDGRDSLEPEIMQTATASWAATRPNSSTIVSKGATLL